jgi:hypothetical protein
MAKKIAACGSSKGKTYPPVGAAAGCDLLILTTDQIPGKKNPGQLMDARDLKMHKPWW